MDKNILDVYPFTNIDFFFNDNFQETQNYTKTLY